MSGPASRSAPSRHRSDGRQRPLVDDVGVEVLRAEVRSDDPRVAANLIGSALRDLTAELDHVHAIADPEHEVHVMIDQQTPDAGGRDLAQLVAERTTLR